jgi:DNA-binding HxlR family transcriptional regulator
MKNIELEQPPITGAWQDDEGFWAKLEEAGANPECDIRRLLRVVLNRWAPLILLNLAQEPRRFGDLRRRIPTLSQKVMTQNLRALEEAGLVSRSVIDTSPPQVTYALTPAAGPLIEQLMQIAAWANVHTSDD